MHAEGEDIEAMVHSARPVSYRTILRHCEGLSDWAERMGYDRHLRLRDDWSVSFWKSSYQGRPCYYVIHSAIEYIWVLS